MAAASVRRVAYGQGLAAGLSQQAAALAAGYKAGRNLKTVASKAAKHPEVLAEIERVQRAARDKATAKRRRALEVLTQQLEFDLGPYLEAYDAPVLDGLGMPILDKHGQAFTERRLRLDVAKIKAEGRTHLLAGLEIRKDGSVKFSLHDKQGAIDRLAKLKGWNKPEKSEVKHEVAAGVKRQTKAELAKRARELLKKM